MSYPSFNFIRPPVPKIWLIFCHGLRRHSDLDFDLSTSKGDHGSPMPWASLLPIFSLLCPAILDLGSGTDRQTLTDLDIEPCTNTIATSHARQTTAVNA